MIYGYLLYEGKLLDRIINRKSKETDIERKHKTSLTKRKEIIGFLNNTAIPKLLTKDYINKLDNVFEEDYCQNYKSKSRDIVHAREGFDITINFLFFNNIDSDHQDIGNKLNFFFNDICKIISTQYNTTASRYKGKRIKSLDQYFNISIKLLEDMWDEETEANNESK